MCQIDVRTIVVCEVGAAGCRVSVSIPEVLIEILEKRVDAMWKHEYKYKQYCTQPHVSLSPGSLGVKDTSLSHVL